MNIYFLEYDDRIKIGKADDVEKRVKQLVLVHGKPTASSFYIEVGKRSLRVEQALHTLLHEYRLPAVTGDGGTEFFSWKCRDELFTILKLKNFSRKPILFNFTESRFVIEDYKDNVKPTKKRPQFNNLDGYDPNSILPDVLKEDDPITFIKANRHLVKFREKRIQKLHTKLQKYGGKSNSDIYSELSLSQLTELNYGYDTGIYLFLQTAIREFNTHPLVYFDISINKLRKHYYSDEYFKYRETEEPFNRWWEYSKINKQEWLG